ncbi:hypothetical protein LFL96_22155 [Paraburkholderia sp. D15]|uniref:hypothetical protein n=1 Tax=Paraburkholderia sp. D15 TaxID=2880218 RepID=UPI00247B13A2|nr:hypothetical protein [Paraburkholderia sp. D15]WGS53751.1 hypothetical protein LFL96_22155 [Paraburkholderia sp. D15]
MTPDYKSKKMSRLPLAMIAFGLLILMLFVLLPDSPIRLSGICKVGEDGSVVPTKVAEGLLSGADGMYSVEESGNNVVLLSGCVGKGVCGPFESGLFVGHEGSPVRAEFCGKHAVRLLISGVEVFRLTQAGLDERAGEVQERIKWVYCAGVLWCCFWLVLQVIAVSRARSESK